MRLKEVYFFNKESKNPNLNFFFFLGGGGGGEMGVAGEGEGG